ncbi:CAP domain-containing protein [Flavobacterium sufflavum]|uniref:CAP domain-containing protein n=1 Tax=Flavobacterium sufflavum TaxID=1921138 RepID=A0A3S3SUD1_9FLAO|nr:CAP domain-containing protein [Flavobacterium sufflavum]RVT74991.1 CAP domain-containing protein [Flavobacterium sufflavum]
MKVNLLKLMLLMTVIFTMNSCSSDSSEETTADNTSAVIVENYTYSNAELETMKLINDYRVSIGLNPLEKINHISYKSEEHDFYMIDNNVVSHDGFVSRSENIMKVLGAKTVGENIAYNYNSPQAALTAWLNSPAHKQNIEGNYTHFGISIRENPTTGKKYYTNIFAKI